jgi:hypothetical protein
METDSANNLILEKRLVLLSGLWLCSMGLLNMVLPLIGIVVTYQEHPFLIASYYLIWLGVLFFAFPHMSHEIFFENSLRSYGFLSFFMAGVTLYYGYVLPAEGIAIATNPDFLRGGPGYLFVKTIEILFQQVLIMLLILTLASYRDDIWFVSKAYAAIFGIAHIALIPKLGLAYTLLFFGAALMSACIFPYIILRIKNGFVYSYIAHWSAYICMTTVIVFFL